jgi:hypothetical protein
MVQRAGAATSEIPMMRRNSLGVLRAAALTAVVLLSWTGCRKKEEVSREVTPPSQSFPVRVLVEVDQMVGTPKLEDEILLEQVKVSLSKIYADAGITLEVRHDQHDLPRLEQVRLADLHSLMATFSSVPPPEGVRKVHALIVTESAEKPSDLGMMFDFDAEGLNFLPRAGFAIFATRHQAFPNATAELLLTAAHELAHCFNLHHPDWEGEDFYENATIESYSGADTVRWALSQNSRRHIREHHQREVWPGRGGLPFGSISSDHLRGHQPNPSGSYSVVDPSSSPVARSTAGGRLGLARETARVHPVDGHPLRLDLSAPQTTFVVGQSIVLTVGLHNAGATSRYVLPLLAPAYGFLNVELRRPGSEVFEKFQPVALSDARGVKPSRLAPKESLHEEVKIFFGAGGWTCETPGVYSVRVDYPAGSEQAGLSGEREGRIQSAVLQFEVKAPVVAEDRRARDLILGYEQGLYLFLGGGDHLKTAETQLRRLAVEAPTAAQAPAARLALGVAALKPTVDPERKVVSPANVEEGQRYLEGVLDSNLSSISVVQAQTVLAEELQKRGEAQQSREVRQETIRKLEQKEDARDLVHQMRRPPGGGGAP